MSERKEVYEGLTFVDGVSDEPLETIASNECYAQEGSLCTKRFRAMWNEIVRLRNEVSFQENMRMEQQQ